MKALRAVRPSFVLCLAALAACGTGRAPAAGPPAPQPRSTMGPVGGAPPEVIAAAPVPALPALPRTDSLDAAIDAALREMGQALGLAAVPASTAGPVTVDSANGETEVTWDIDVTSYATHERVANYVALFTGPAKERIQTRLQRGKQYERMIREKFRAQGIPEDMYYLGLVESGYDPHAYSRAAAVGMWQFMSSTARGVGLRVDWWVDERRDPVKSTDAAARFLNILHNQFGSYYLAAAAYNGGPGRVSRGLARFQDELEDAEGDDRFFALAEQSYLRSETRNYVPQLIAAALIGKEPSRYGLVVSDSVEPFLYDSVRVGELVSLGAVARAVSIDPAQVRDLNPHLLRGATPPRADAWVRVPSGRAVGFDSAFLAIPDSERVGIKRVRAKKGQQTLKSIAAAHGLDTRRLAWYNPGVSTTKKLPVGKELLVPSGDVLLAARDVPDPDIERYGTSGRSGGRVVHVVRRGESLGLIARRYRTSVASLQRVNGLKKTIVYPGQSIIVRGGSSARSRSAAARKPAARTAPARKPATSANKAP